MTEPTVGEDAEARARAERHVGRPRERREDPDLLTGNAEYTDDITAPGETHLAFVRSPHGHADVEAIDTRAAEAMDGVLAAYTWADLREAGIPGRLPITDRVRGDVPGHPVLADGRVRYQGQPVAAVVAESRYRAADAAAAVDVSYTPREAAVDPVDATASDAPTLFEACPDNVATAGELGDEAATDAAFEDADEVVELDLVNNRLVANAMEPRAALARVHDGTLRVEMTSQSPHRHRSKLAQTLGLRENDVRVVAPDVGGGFGHKGHHHPGEAMAAWAARELDRPVKWVATRSENYQAGAHGRDHVTTAALAFDADGTIRGLRADTYAGVGGYGLGSGPALATWYGRLLAGEYEIPAVCCRTRGVFTNTAPVHSYRGAGRPEAIYVLERLVKRAADALGCDPAAFRRRNLLDPDDFPHETAVGATYDSGEYEAAMDRALDLVDYEAVREKRGEEGANGERGKRGERGERAERDDGRLVGVGLANFVESTGGGFESGVVRVHPDGGVTVFAGTHSHGQGHATTYAQIVADELGIPDEDVEVVEGDTDRIPAGTGTFGSRSTITAGSALAESAADVREKARDIAASELEAAPEDTVFEDGAFHVAGAPEQSVAFADVARAAYGRLPGDLEPGLEETTFFEQEETAYAFGTHAAVVAVDPETGEVDVERYVAVDDCGVQVNPKIVEGQVHGGVAQGLGQALYEGAQYDENGTLLTGSMQDYTVPKADQIPELTTDATETPSPTNPLGVKGIGEAGTIAAPPAVVNAVVDALEPYGVDHVDMPLTEERVWRAIQQSG
ncbi:xanthine dehydrogenase family protein molybdopterin-binding subunit [Halocalculus aciditolerans]|uniref:Aldehyde dehydrogenase n=1 Tax=Halocalculus aciditolerans TaxID=1383812 RepID=A0A830FAQ5_9EURY|nr:xanthine dehydrogenase family protein molybdopterin-binding subunit [Halocalculus aciditolerans]GGL56394.1 aldehyde dehydrogenase [Halocalculus aciditolerans]